jgi:GTP-binding protein Era
LNTEQQHRAGFVAIVGRPNVGKSTLLNALMQQKLSIVSNKPQTTRHRVLGILNQTGYQLVLVDTPGLHSDGKRALNSVMNKTAQASLVEADMICFVVEAGRFTDEDQRVLERIKQSQLPCVLVLNKVDRVHPRSLLLPMLTEFADKHDFIEIIPLSALKRDRVAQLPALLAKHLPISPKLFPEEQVTDRSLAFRATEIVREKLMRHLSQEVPYGLTVELEREQLLEDGRMELHVVIWVEREGQKKIVIGEGGHILKSVGTQARADLNRLYATRTHLNLWVKVRENWSDDLSKLKSLGYDAG